MGGSEKAEYLALLAQRDAKIRRLLDEGYEFVTNAFKPGFVPPGVKAREDREIARSHTKDGYQVELSTAYDERGSPRLTMSAIWRKKG